jgi:hypothetical protein
MSSDCQTWERSKKRAQARVVKNITPKKKPLGEAAF